MFNRLPRPFTLTIALVLSLSSGIVQLAAPLTTNAAQEASGTWNSAMVWRATLPEAADGLAEVLNDIDASCSVDVDPVVASGGSAPEGPVYAFAITWSCADLGMGMGPGPAAPQAIVNAVDITFEPTQLMIPANTDASLTVTNEGSMTHNFTIDALEISLTLAPGEEANLTVNALPGTYEYYCNVPGHREFGMTGTLIVT
jgi:plastocyanin